MADRAKLQRRLQRVGIALAQGSVPDPLGERDGAADAVIDMAQTADTRGIPCAFVQRDSHINPVAGRQVWGLDHLVLSSAGAAETGFFLAAQLGLDMRLDMLRPEWGVRMMFFRCGDLILEVIEQLEPEEPREPGVDTFYGLSWRVDNADAAQAALAMAEFDVSAVRTGRKPGTRVFTVRDRTAGIATLMLQPPA